MNRFAPQALLVASVAAAVSFAAPPGPATAASCRYYATARAGRWERLPQPPAPLASVGQLDGDPCALVGAAEDGTAWQSSDGGAHWSATAQGARVADVTTESLSVTSADGRTTPGPLLASGTPAGDPLTQVTSPLVSRDGGRSFARARLVANGVPVDWRGAVVAAASAQRYVAGKATPNLYAVVRQRVVGTPAPLSDPAAASPVNVLVVSTDGGETFRVVSDTDQRVPSVVAVNPASPDEVWVNDTRPGGGAWVSIDAGVTWKQQCCEVPATVYALAVAPTGQGGVQVLAATDHGLMRSVDDGGSWDTVYDKGPVYGVRTPPDDPGTVVITTATGALVGEPGAVAFRPLPGLPADCRPSALRRDGRVPPVFLVDCGGAGGTYRLLMTTYGGSRRGSGAITPVVSVPDVPPAQPPQARPIPELATWKLPDSNTASGAIAFGGTALFYDRNAPGEIGMVDARDGAFLGVIKTDLAVFSLSFDLRRDQLVVTTRSSQLYTYDLRSRRLAYVSDSPYKVPSYDSSIDAYTWVEEYKSVFYRAPRAGGPATEVCTVKTYSTFGSYDINASTFVAGGDGGGYIESESDSELYRFDRRCRVVGHFSHRHFSESSAENDALACDTQSYFPQPAIWIRDSGLGTVSAYGVPYGYCPMPSRLDLTGPASLHIGASGQLCARLTNATTGLPARARGVSLSVGGAQVGHAQTDDDGRACVTYTAPPAIPGVVETLAVTAHFAGDSALYPSDGASQVTVFSAYPPVPPRPPVAIVVAPPPVPPALPPAPLPNPGPVPVPQPAPAPAPNPVQAAQGQAQSQTIPQGVVVPQRQQQPQLVFARAANAIQRELAGDEPMTMLPSGRSGRLPAPSPLAGVCGLLAACAVARATAVALRRIEVR